MIPEFELLYLWENPLRIGPLITGHSAKISRRHENGGAKPFQGPPEENCFASHAFERLAEDIEGAHFGDGEVRNDVWEKGHAEAAED